MEREQIIKDLECCKFGKDEAKCKECNWHPWIKPRCWRLLASNALTLIKELTEENERLREDNEIKSQKRANIFEIADAFERGRTDGAKKMQERLKNTFDHRGLVGVDIIMKRIDQIAKEMVEGEK